MPLSEESLKFTELRPLLRLRPRTPVSSLGQLCWEIDEDVDLEYHVRPCPRARDRGSARRVGCAACV